MPFFGRRYYATNKSVEALKKFYPKATTSMQRLVLKELGMKQIGHFGFFSRKSKEKLWREAPLFQPTN
jgi:predicted alpha/beta hydrolase